MPNTRKLTVFISYASPDVDRARDLYWRLSAKSWISPWFDKEMLLPAMDWDLEIYKALRAADAIIIFLSTKSVSKEGYGQKEIKRALDFAEEKPEGTNYIFPLRLDDCRPPVKIQQYQWLDYFAGNAIEKLLQSLRLRAEILKIPIDVSRTSAPAVTLIANSTSTDADRDLYQFVKIASPLVPEPFWMGKYPVTNAQYERFLKAVDFANPAFWTGFSEYAENGTLIGNWGDSGLQWLKTKLKEHEYFSPEILKGEPEYWQDKKFGLSQPRNPVVGVSCPKHKSIPSNQKFFVCRLKSNGSLPQVVIVQKATTLGICLARPPSQSRTLPNTPM